MKNGSMKCQCSNVVFLVKYTKGNRKTRTRKLYTIFLLLKVPPIIIKVADGRFITKNQSSYFKLHNGVDRP